MAKVIIIGGGIENEWGYTYLTENLARKFVPNVFDQFIPFYGTVVDYAKSLFNVISEFALGTIYVETFSYDEFMWYTKLISNFNFSHKSLFMTGHSISGSTIKEFSYISRIPGLAFEATPSQQYAEYRVIEDYINTTEYQNFTKETDHKQNVANVPSISIFSGIDEDFDVNAKLFHHFKFPNVYDTACHAVVACSKTTKYEPFCRQVLLKDADEVDSTIFDKLIESFYKRYT